MSGFFGIIVISLSVGLSNFAGAIGIGVSGVDSRTRLKVGIAFGLFEALMPIIGLLIGAQFAGSLGHAGRIVGGILLVATGAYTIWQGRRVSDSPTVGNEPSPEKPALGMRELMFTAVALSIDNLVVGFALGANHFPLVLAAITMGVVSVALSLVGLELGHRIGRRWEKWSEEIGGAVLILVGIAIGFGLI